MANYLADLVTSVLSPTSLLIFLVVFYVCYELVSPSNLPPGPFKLPVIGNIWWFLVQQMKKRRPPEAIWNFSKQYGEIVHFKMGKENLIVIHGYEAIHDAFVKHSDEFSSRPSRIMAASRKDAPGNGVVFESGKPWKDLRRFTMQALKDFGVGKTTLEEKIVVEINAATEYLNAQGGKPLELRQLLSMMITNLIYGIVFGKRFEYTDARYHEIIETLDTLLQRSSPLDPLSQFPAVLWKLTNNKERLRGLEEQKRSVKWVREHIRKEIASHEATFDDNNIRDFVDLFIQIKRQESDTSIYSVDNLFYVIVDLFVAGSETTSNTLNWMILYMQEYPEIQRRCQQEIKEKYGDRHVTWADRGTLPYVDATLMELQRVSNIAELTVPHTNEREVIFRGYRIPKDSLIEASLLSANMDPKYWDEPNTFNPDRFIKNGKLTKNPSFIPFSLGPRVCLGENLAKMELFLIFTSFLQRFTFHREQDEMKHSFGKIFEQLTSAPLPYKTKAVSRNADDR